MMREGVWWVKLECPKKCLLTSPSFTSHILTTPSKLEERRKGEALVRWETGGESEAKRIWTQPIKIMIVC